jgi:hypothetical protein
MASGCGLHNCAQGIATAKRAKKIEGMFAMNKAQIVAELEAMVSTRLFGHRAWLTDREAGFAVHQRLIDLGLVEPIPGRPGTWQDTPVGKEVDVELFEVFIGLLDVGEMLFILENRCLVDEHEADAISERMCRKTNPESVLMGYVRRAYFDYRNANKFLH